jgi:hypothetical protein
VGAGSAANFPPTGQSQKRLVAKRNDLQGVPRPLATIYPVSRRNCASTMAINRSRQQRRHRSTLAEVL